ncbi:hypothetical protein ACXR2U_11760 [Jatrophihabitans sp. YIM 134969]
MTVGVVQALGLGAAGGAGLAATAVTPLVLWNGPLEAVLVYPPLFAVPGAAVGAVAGGAVALVVRWRRRRTSRPSSTAGPASASPVARSGR